MSNLVVALLISQAVREVNKQQQMGIQVYMTALRKSLFCHQLGPLTAKKAVTPV